MLHALLSMNGHDCVEKHTYTECTAANSRLHRADVGVGSAAAVE
jgi:hypothetical protein